MRRLPPEQEQEIARLYEAGATVREIGPQFGIHHNAVYKVLHRAGATIRTMSDSCRSYSLRQDAFASLDTEEAAYWAGFLAADGTVYGNDLHLNLTGGDRDHVERLRAWLGSGRPIYTDKRGKVLFSCRSVRMVKDLSRYGIIDRKTYTFVRRPDVPESMVAHFYRGSVDGDGGFARFTSSREVRGSVFPYTQASFNLCGTKEFLEEFDTWLRAALGLRPVKISYGRGIWRIIRMGVPQTAAIANLLYKDATVYLPRKQNLAREIRDLAMETPLAARRYPTLAALPPTTAAV